MLRFLLTVVFFLLPGSALAVIDYQLDLQLFPTEQRLTATAVITPERSDPQQLELQLAEHCELLALHQADTDLNYVFRNGLLRVQLINREPLSISYRGKFADPVSQTPVHNEDPSYGVSASISAAGTFLSASADWYPRPRAQAVRYRLAVTTPAGIEAVTSGQRLERVIGAKQNRSVWSLDYPIYGLTVVAGAYQVHEEMTGKVPIYAYFYAESAKLAPVYLQAARDYLDLYQELFGPYPFAKFAVVENFFPTGYGFPSWTLLGSSVIRLPFIVKTSLGHEIAHSWWGTGVRVDYRQGNWSEGLTTYVADYLYKERASKAEAFEYRLKVLRSYAELVNSDNAFPVAHFMSRNDKASQSIGYGKTALIFHMLRVKLGDELFWSVLRKIAREKMFQQIGWNEFERQFSTASGVELSTFFAQWLQRKSGPQLILGDVTITNPGDGYRVSGSLLQEAPYYHLPVQLQLETAAGEVREVVLLKDRSVDFELSSPELPVTLVADPDADLFRILSDEEIPPTTNAVRGSTDLLAVRADQYLPSPAAQATLLAALRKDSVTPRLLTELKDSELADHDLLIFGENQRLQSGLLANAEISLAGEQLQLAGNSAFIVLPHPLNRVRTAAWFLSADAQNDAVVARKIPHYGKYSYLLFEGVTNRLKGTFPAPVSPLRIEFSKSEF